MNTETVPRPKTLVAAGEIQWTAFPEPVNWGAHLPENASLADVLVATIKRLRAKNELLSMTLAQLQGQDKEIARQKKRIAVLCIELRETTRLLMEAA